MSIFISFIISTAFLFNFFLFDKIKDILADSGITKLGNVGDKIDDLDPNYGFFYGNIETCPDSSTCIGTDNDDVILGGSKSFVYALEGDDVIFGGLDSNLFGGDGNDIVLTGTGKSIADGGPGDDAMMGGIGNDLLNGGKGDDKLFAGTGDTVMKGGSGANHFDCPLSLLGLARAIVLDYNPENGDTIGGQCKVINNVDDPGADNVPKLKLPD